MRYFHIVELISPTAVPVVSAHTVPVAKAYLRKYGKEACEIRFGTSRLRQNSEHILYHTTVVKEAFAFFK